VSDSVDSHETLTFVVRLWRETAAGSHGHWRGRVEHVASQEVGYVEDVAGVARYIERWTMRTEEEMPMQRSELSGWEQGKSAHRRSATAGGSGYNGG
jgi:hypothetical protein